MPATPQTAPNRPWILPRSSTVNRSPTIVIATGCMPPAPTPWSARNAMSCVIDVARPLAIEPARKSATPRNMVGLRP